MEKTVIKSCSTRMFSNCAAFGSDQEEEEPGDAVDVGEEETVELGHLLKFKQTKIENH